MIQVGSTTQFCPFDMRKLGPAVVGYVYILCRDQGGPILPQTLPPLHKNPDSGIFPVVAKYSCKMEGDIKITFKAFTKTVRPTVSRGVEPLLTV